MKTSTAHKLKVMRSAIKAGQKPTIHMPGGSEWKVADLRNLNYAVELKLDRREGTIVIDPDDIVAVHVVSIPSSSDD